MKKFHKLIGFILSLTMITLISGCGGGSSDTSPATSTTETGTLVLNLKDAPGDFQAVYVTIKEVQVHMGDDEDQESSTTEDNAVAEDQDTTDSNAWITVISPNKTYDLLELQNGVEAVLGEEDLTAGHYTQMRLILDSVPDKGNNIQDEDHPFGNYVIINGNYFEITIPSSMQSGIKLIKGFDIEADTTTELTLDFDAEKSISLTNDGTYKMNPTITITQE